MGEYFFLHVLNGSIHNYSDFDQKRLFLEARRRTSENNNENRLVAMVTANSSLSELVAFGNADPLWVSDYGQELTDVASLDGEAPELRRVAIKGLYEIRHRDAIPALMDIAADARALNLAPVVRSACIALADFEAVEAIGIIGQILQTTDDKYIFGSAAIALGQLGGPDALTFLVNSADRFNEGCVDVAIRQLESLIFDIIASGDTKLLSTAVEASHYLYKTEQLVLIKSSLKNLLSSSDDNELLRMVLKRLQPMINPAEARAILDNMSFAEEYREEWEWLKRYGGSVIVPPIEKSESSISSRNVAYSVVQEYGDPGYRENGIGWWIFNVKSLGHTGLCAGINAADDLRCIEVGQDGDTGGGIYDNSWSRMINNSDNLEFWGSFQPSNKRLTFEDRRNVMDTAIYFIGRDIGYPSDWFSPLPIPTIPIPVPGGDILDHTANPGSIINPAEIKNLRCDGLIEYTYERNGIQVWGKNGSNYDISITANLEDHNTLYQYSQYTLFKNPNTGLAPVVQCGLEGGTSTFLTQDAIINLPEYHVSKSIENNVVHLFVKATDESGIHKIFCKPENYSGWIDGDVLDQHSSSDNYRQEFVFVLPIAQGDYEVKYFAVDNGGNGSPDYAETVVINVCAGSPNPPQLQSPTDGATNVDQDLCFDWGDIPGVTDYRIQYGLEEDGTQPWDDVTLSGSDAVSHYCPPEGFQAKKHYWWRVRVWTSCGFSAWSDYNWFTTKCDSIEPPKPYIWSQCSPLYVAFPPVPGALEYGYQADCYGAKWYENDRWEDTLISVCGLGLTTLRIRTHSDCDTSDIVSIDVFGYAQPDRPLLVSPSNVSLDIGQPVFLDWDDQSLINDGAVSEYYELQVDINSSFTDAETIHSPESNFTVSGLAEGAEYFWRVRACNSCYNSDHLPASWTTPWSFTTQCPLPASPTLASPINGAADVADGDILIWTPIEGIDYYHVQVSSTADFVEIVVNDTIENSEFTFNDELNPILGYNWKVRSISDCGESDWSDVGSFSTNDTWTDIGLVNSNELPADFALFQNYPNPFNPTTIIEFALSRAEHVTLDIYNVLGEKVETLISENLTVGSWSVTWDGKEYPSGMYFYKINAGEFTDTKKMILLK